MKTLTKTRIQALKWFMELDQPKWIELKIKYFNDLATPNADKITYIWFKETNI